MIDSYCRQMCKTIKKASRESKTLSLFVILFSYSKDMTHTKNERNMGKYGKRIKNGLQDKGEKFHSSLHRKLVRRGKLKSKNVP